MFLLFFVLFLLIFVLFLLGFFFLFVLFYFVLHTVLLNMNNFQTNLFNPEIVSQQLLRLRTKVDLEVMAMEGYSTFSKSPELIIRYSLVSYLEHPIFEGYSQHILNPHQGGRLHFEFYEIASWSYMLFSGVMFTSMEVFAYGNVLT